ncbi:SMC family ATPase [Solihabitans fulvus]|uniref:Nuclease SbcCD subunit C n=1 Tax=Solihabitans fulvus TaxID=1892852 RepID=A0A5B2XKC5_9PSEU|nr:SMC family ATPase [Solihabitans fulvus]KAA2263222.1 SMC family ATPase [Solihabitans fulvus]
MRLHLLEVTAFGPYPRHETVDFDALGGDGLFLLHGDTGAGKTTLLDAVAFALFGTVPGARGDVKRLRCDFAEPDTMTEVALELTVQGHRLRLTRSPEYERPKLRGEGVTRQQAKASLTWLTPAPGGEPVEGLTRIDEVSRTVGRLLGMSAEQFFQVVLLPQGEFARFLRAETAEREQLLEKLFGTEHFADVERWFRDRRQERRSTLDAHKQVAGQLVARVAQAAGEEPPDGDGDAEWLSSVVKRRAEATAEAARLAAIAAAERIRSSAALAAARDTAERLRRRSAAEATLAECAAEEPRLRQWEAERDAARRALAVLPANRVAVELAGELDRAREQEARAAARCGRLDFAGTGGPVSALLVARDELREEAGGLTQLAAEAEQHRADLVRLDELADEERAAVEDSTRVAEAVAAQPMALALARTAVDEANRAEASVAGLRAQQTEFAELVEIARRLPGTERDAVAVEDELRAAVDAHQLARERSQEIRARRLDGMAAELAGRLTAGEPCPVCGGTEHPAPATPVPEAVSESDERAAAEVADRAEQRRRELELRRESVQQTLALQRERLAGRTGETLTAELASADQALAEAETLAAQREQRAAELAELELRGAALTAQRIDAEQQVAAAKTERTGLAEAVAVRAVRLDTARGAHPDVLARRRHLVELAEAVGDLAAARQSTQDLATRAATALAEADSAAHAAGFPDVRDAIAAARDAAEVTALDRRITELTVARNNAEATLAAPELTGLPEDATADLTAVTEQAESALASAESAASVRDAAKEAEDRVGALAARLLAAWAELEPIEAEFAELDALTDVVNGRGQNARKMSLRSYVLAARLEEVAVTATRRLERMSQGRYSFVHSDAAGARGTRGGLGLDVLDDYSGRVRPAKTLSGGESFLASLALALGLADVVAAETGGALLDTLFVDEGFGTLDADTLDLVMNTLDELRAGGRVVGLVSHVEELRQRIPVRLRVRKARTGSTVEITAA